jgi:hypothetical protein
LGRRAGRMVLESPEVVQSTIEAKSKSHSFRIFTRYQVCHWHRKAAMDVRHE